MTIDKTDPLYVAIYSAVLAAIEKMGKDELLKCSWFQYRKNKK
jgi:hypothetical protein